MWVINGNGSGCIALSVGYQHVLTQEQHHLVPVLAAWRWRESDLLESCVDTFMFLFHYEKCAVLITILT